jgi:DNA-binding response OmpR family regulator
MRAADGRSRTVLLVEDDADLSTMVSEVLREQGHRVVRAQTGEAAVRVLASMRVDVLLLDLRLGGALDGAEVWQRLSALDRAPAVVVTSGADALPPALALAGVVQLRKPYDLDLLLDVVASGGR